MFPDRIEFTFQKGKSLIWNYWLEKKVAIKEGWGLDFAFHRWTISILELENQPIRIRKMNIKKQKDVKIICLLYTTARCRATTEARSGRVDNGSTTRSGTGGIEQFKEKKRRNIEWQGSNQGPQGGSEAWRVRGALPGPRTAWTGTIVSVKAAAKRRVQTAGN